jgi:hypothetical protein
VLDSLLRESVRKAATVKSETLIKGFLENFFTPQQLWIVANVHQIQLEIELRYLAANKSPNSGWQSVSRFAEELKVPVERLEAELRKLKRSRRGLRVARVEVPPLVLHDDVARCRGNLLSAVQVLRPDLVAQVDGETQMRNHLASILKPFLA